MSHDTVSQKNVALLVGAVLSLVGLFGFFQNPVFGWFGTDTVHNVVNLVLGLWGLYAATQGGVGNYLRTGGLIAVVVGLLGLLGIGGDKILGLIASNGNSDWLHTIGGLLMVAAGYMGLTKKL